MGPFLPLSLVHGAPTATFPAEFDDKPVRTAPPDGLEPPASPAHLVPSATSSLPTPAPLITDLTSQIDFSCPKIPRSTPLGAGTDGFQGVNFRMGDATRSCTQFLPNMAPVVLTDGTAPSRAEGLYLKLMLPTRGIQVLGPVERASLKLYPLPQGSFQRFFSENYIARTHDTPKTPADLGRFVLPDHSHIIPTVFSPNLGPFGSRPPTQPPLSAQANFTETVDFSKFEAPVLSLPSSDHRTSHLPFIIGPQTHAIPTARPIRLLPAAKYPPPVDTFWAKTALFSPPDTPASKAAATTSWNSFETENNYYIKQLKRYATLLYDVKGTACLWDYLPTKTATHPSEEGTGRPPVLRSPSLRPRGTDSQTLRRGVENGLLDRPTSAGSSCQPLATVGKLGCRAEYQERHLVRPVP